MTPSGTPSTTIEYEQATTYRRFFARLLDLFLIVPFLFTLSMVLVGSLGHSFSPGQEAPPSMATIAGGLFTLFLLAYEVLMHRLAGGTVGKLLLNLRVVDIQGHRLGWGRAIARAVVLYACGIGLAFAVAITLSLFGWIFIRGLGRYERFPQDRAAKGFVVRLYKGEPRRLAPGTPSPILATPLADLERLRAQGMISQEEYERKRKELGA